MDEKNNRLVALKILPQELNERDPAFAERFVREAEALAKLDHPNILQVYSSGKAGPFYYLELEYVNGLTLRQAMKQGLEANEGLKLLPPLCDALEAAHAAGILHRDIKPENILLDAEGKPKLADFGIARLREDKAYFALTLTGNSVGTVHYMAPEQIERPQSVDHRADVYALGVVAYELITQELPLGRFPLPSEISSVSRSIDAVILKALAKQPQQRFTSARAFKAALEKPGTILPYGRVKKRLIRPAGAPRRMKHSVEGIAGFGLIVAVLISAVIAGVLLVGEFATSLSANRGYIWVDLVRNGPIFLMLLLVALYRYWRGTPHNPPTWCAVLGLALAWKAGHGLLWLRCGIVDPTVLLVIPGIALLNFQWWWKGLGKWFLGLVAVAEAFLLALHFTAASPEILSRFAPPGMAWHFYGWPGGPATDANFSNVGLLFHVGVFTTLICLTFRAFLGPHVQPPSADKKVKINGDAPIILCYLLGAFPQFILPERVRLHTMEYADVTDANAVERNEMLVKIKLEMSAPWQSEFKFGNAIEAPKQTVTLARGPAREHARREMTVRIPIASDQPSQKRRVLASFQALKEDSWCAWPLKSYFPLCSLENYQFLYVFMDRKSTWLLP